MTVYDIIIEPVLSEKSYDGIAMKRYTFKVAKNATKPEIAPAVEVMFNVKVDKVNTINMKRKAKRQGYTSGYTAAWKKAIVTLKSDSKTIEFFEGMV